MTGRYLYKYVSFDVDMRVMDILDKYSIMFSPPSRFNDPFDCNPRYLDSPNPRASRPDLFKRIDRSDLSPAKNRILREQAVHRMRAGLKDDSMRQTILAGVGIVSLTRNPWSVLMWSHYADKHTGFMVEFETRSEFSKEQNGHEDRWLVAFGVKYVNERPSVSYWGETDALDVEKTFTYKSKEWEYEQEERVIKYSGGAGAFPFEPELLTSVIAGSKISESNFKILKNSIRVANKTRQKKIKLYRAEIDQKDFKLNIPKFSRPRPAMAK